MQSVRALPKTNRTVTRSRPESGIGSARESARETDRDRWGGHVSVTESVTESVIGSVIGSVTESVIGRREGETDDVPRRGAEAGAAIGKDAVKTSSETLHAVAVIAGVTARGGEVWSETGIVVVTRAGRVRAGSGLRLGVRPLSRLPLRVHTHWLRRRGVRAKGSILAKVVMRRRRP